MSRIRYLILVTVLLVLSVALSACQTGGSTVAENRPATEESKTKVDEGTITGNAEAAVPSGSLVFKIDTDQSSASYIVDEEFLPDALSKYGIAVGRTDTIGISQSVEGQLELDFDNPISPLGENTFRVDLSQLTSDQSLRDQWLQERGPEFSKYPDAMFVAEAIEGASIADAGKQDVPFRLAGDLTIRDITKPATFDVVATLDGDTLHGTATARLLMSEFGIDPPDFANTLRVQDDFEVKIDFVAVQH